VQAPSAAKAPFRHRRSVAAAAARRPGRVWARVADAGGDGNAEGRARRRPAKATPVGCPSVSHQRRAGGGSGRADAVGAKSGWRRDNGHRPPTRKNRAEKTGSRAPAKPAGSALCPVRWGNVGELSRRRWRGSLWVWRLPALPGSWRLWRRCERRAPQRAEPAVDRDVVRHHLGGCGACRRRPGSCRSWTDLALRRSDTRFFPALRFLRRAERAAKSAPLVRQATVIVRRQPGGLSGGGQAARVWQRDAPGPLHGIRAEGENAPAC
jgi:hypothetical protein